YNGYGGTSLTKSMLDSFIYGEFEKPSTHYKKTYFLLFFYSFVEKSLAIATERFRSSKPRKNPCF
ncbi:hypothetical protein, partial [Sporomusa acidovorans]